ILKPIYERRTGVIEPLKLWDQSYLQSLQTMNRVDEAFAKAGEMIGNYPFDQQVQISYAQMLVNRGEIDASIKFINDVISKNGPWLDYDLRQLKNTVSNTLLNAHRLEELVTYIDGWWKEQPDAVDGNILNQYLTSLILLGRDDQATQLILEWLSSGRK